MKTSKQYCPECNSFKIHRKSRGFFKSKILKTPKEYECSSCKTVFTILQIECNSAKELPLLLD